MSDRALEVLGVVGGALLLVAFIAWCFYFLWLFIETMEGPKL